MYPPWTIIFISSFTIAPEPTWCTLLRVIHKFMFDSMLRKGQLKLLHIGIYETFSHRRVILIILYIWCMIYLMQLLILLYFSLVLALILTLILTPILTLILTL